MPFETAAPQMEIRDAADLVKNTLILKVSLGMLGNSKKVGEDVLNTDADHDFFKVSKTLLDSEELDAIRKADFGLRIWLKNVCLPFEKGISLVPTGMLSTTIDRLKRHETDRSVLVQRFIQAYPFLKAKAEESLGPQYNPMDYPPVEQVLARFTFSWHFISLGVPGQLKLVSEQLFEEEKARHSEKLQNATEEITHLMRSTLFDMVEKLKTRLTPDEEGKPRRLHETAITNVLEFVNTLDLRNVANDTELKAVSDQVRELLTGTTAAQLRSSDEMKERIRSEMDSVTNALSTMIESRPLRRFREEGEE